MTGCDRIVHITGALWTTDDMLILSSYSGTSRDGDDGCRNWASESSVAGDV